ncbi:MAG: S49 family peptidase [Candidatus Thiodiazotropha endolucinida]|uniref:S49 family peptidase n=1 Tax=Candidatus Thiodiazotropha taylori TaxID=2792791 RepID=A0A9E4NJY4_9GAMM|nr:S49 family peptidase [Candidatus Thiodiazotropha taylori]MCW4236373.1 S49 family peptidase [Candidatus Thiodiazotropha endolucinida]
MPNWNQVLKEIQSINIDHPIDSVRRKYLKQLSKYTGRVTIAYYSGWLDARTQSPILIVNDEDKNAFMSVVHKANRAAGLDLILHTPGGNIAAAESIVNYLRQMFGSNIRAIIPQLAMSAGTMIACSCNQIIMGKQSNIGPIDPQVNGIPASGVIEEFETAIKIIKKDPSATPMWQAIVGKYHPTFLGECQKAIEWSKEITKEWLMTGMFEGIPNAEVVASTIVDNLSDHGETKTHSRHIHVDACEAMGLKITRMETDDKLQDLILTTHHAFMHTFSGSDALKIVENERGISMVRRERLS